MSKRQHAKTLTVLGLGSLLSERSSRLTLPDLTNFRLVRLHNYRRVFAHTPSVFVKRGIADFDTLEMASLSAEPCEGMSFICTAFEVEDDGSGMDAFREREEEFDLKMVEYEPLDHDADADGSSSKPLGMLCARGSDQLFVQQWGQPRFDEEVTNRGLRTIWDWPADSGLRPCAAYLRHCALAAEKLGPMAHESFLDDTYLCDRKTSVRQYLEEHPEVLTKLPPPELAERYSG